MPLPGESASRIRRFCLMCLQFDEDELSKAIDTFIESENAVKLFEDLAGIQDYLMRPYFSALEAEDNKYSRFINKSLGGKQ